ncbi:MAG: glycoside hydrolase family 3 C-terminal domain-containing protein [Lachnospiraceae bacterium]|nr:glycoside hydrolase family 3 C-terminal domain-containing protein [Lachnospiraceae bacterium]
MAKFHTTTNPLMSEREKVNAQRARKVAAQGMVLLENKGALPLKNETMKLALFGNGARRTVKGGTGSGDVNSRFVVNVEQGLEAAGYEITSKSWLDSYDRLVNEAQSVYFAHIREYMEQDPQLGFLEMFNNQFVDPPVLPITDEDLAGCDSDTAIYVIARNSGEGKDRSAVPGDYELYEEEKAAIRALETAFAHVVVVLNVGSVIDTKFLRGEKGIGALLLMSQAGNIGGLALADVLTGNEMPSGHLTTTWAENYEDYPCSDTFSHVNGDVDDEYYREGIYVGYRYFDSFGITPAYPFGYGLSYTTFDVQTQDVSVSGDKIRVKVSVKNTGDTCRGREVVQVYYSAPEGAVEKPWQELAAYAKTGILAPGEEEVLTMSFPAAAMASYDESRASYVLDPGVYYIRVGVHSRATHVAAAVTLDAEAVTARLSNRLAPDCEMDLLSAKGAASFTYEGEEQEKASAVRLALSAAAIGCEAITYSGVPKDLVDKNPDTVLTADDVREGRATLEELVAQLSVEEMATLCVGTARGGGIGPNAVIGSASAVCPGAAGDTTSLMIDDRNIRNMILADGPAGLRLITKFEVDANGNKLPGNEMALPGMEELIKETPIPEDATSYYQYCTAIPIATLLAQSWDLDVIEEAGSIVGEEMIELGVTLWLAPGMNIHRNPLCGRNFEYYSEDPLVAGLCAAADTKGVQKFGGIGTTIKHFALNNQEDNRMHSNSHVSERAAREIFLKGFEIAVKTSQPMSIMTSYNLINGTHSANNCDLLNAICRDEWGFEGFVMTDWGTTGSIEMEPGKTFKYACSNAAGCIKAGNELTMPGCEEDVNEIIRSVGAKEGDVPYPLTLGELQCSAKRLLNSILKSSVYDD